MLKNRGRAVPGAAGLVLESNYKNRAENGSNIVSVSSFTIRNLFKFKVHYEQSF